MAGYTLPGSGHSDLVEVRPSPSLLQTACPSASSCLPSPCPVVNSSILGEEPLSPQGPEEGWWQACGGPGLESTWACICLHNSSSRSCDVCSSVRDQGGRCSSDPLRSAPLWVIAVLLPLLSVAVIITVVLTLRHLGVKQDTWWCLNKSSPQKTAAQGTENYAFFSDDVVSVRAGETVEERRPPDIILNDNQGSGMGLYHEADATGVQTVTQGSELDYYEIDSYSITFHSDTDSLKRHGKKHCNGPCCTKADPRERGRDIQNLLESKKSPLSQIRTTKSEQPKRLSPSLHPELRPYVDTYHLLPCHPQGPKRSVGPGPTQALSADEVRQLNDAPQTIRSPTANNISAECGTGSGSEFESGQPAVTAHTDITDNRLALGSLVSKHPSKSTPSGAPAEWGHILNTCVQFSTFAGVFEDIASLPSEIKCDTQTDLGELI